MKDFEIRMFCIEIATKLIPDQASLIVDFAARLEKYILRGYLLDNDDVRNSRQECEVSEQ